MADYAKLIVRGYYSKASDYSDPVVNLRPAEFELTPDEYVHQEIQADTGGTTIELGAFSTVTSVTIINHDATNFVQAAWTYTTEASVDTANIQQVPPGGYLMFGSTNGTNALIKISTDLVLTADTAACECEVFITGT